MGRVLTNNTALAYSKESSLGVASEEWKTLEPNDIGAFGPEIATVAREPISKDRQRKKGTITDLDSVVEVEADLTLDSLIDFIECFTFSIASGAAVFTAFSATVTTDLFTVHEDASGMTATSSLVYARGFTNAANNGLHLVSALAGISASASDIITLSVGAPSDGETITIGAIVYTWKDIVVSANDVFADVSFANAVDNLAAAINRTGTPGVEYGVGTVAHPQVTAVAASPIVTVTSKEAGTPSNSIVTTETMTNGVWTNGDTTLLGGVDDTIAVLASSLVTEVPAVTDNVTVEEAGVRGATGDFEIDSSGNLISSSLDFTTLPLQAGQVIHIGGEADAQRFVNDGLSNFGFARIVGTPTANEIVLDKKGTPFATDDGATKDIDILFGRFIRNVDVDDVDFNSQSLTFEAAWDGLADDETDEYEYAIGNFCNEVSFELPLTDKATATFGFIGIDTEAPTGTRKTGAGSPLEAVQTTAFNTTADIARLRVTEADETGLTTDFKSMTLTLNNNVSPEKVIGTLGARFMNNGIFEVSIETSVLFTNGDVLAAIRANDTVTMDFALQNSDGGAFVDIPAMTLGDGARELPVNETVLLSIAGTAFKDPILGTSISVSIFPFLPA